MQGFREVIVNLAAYALDCRFEIRIAGEDECACVGLYTPHGADNRKAVTRFANIQIRQQDIELLCADQFQSFGNTTYRGEQEAAMGQHSSQRRSQCVVVVHEQ